MLSISKTRGFHPLRFKSLPSVLILMVIAGCQRTVPSPTPSTRTGAAPQTKIATGSKKAPKPAPTLKMTVPQALGVGILESLNANPALRGHRISVGTDATRVILNGEVKTAAQKQLAERIARQKAAKYKVSNQIKIANA